MGAKLVIVESPSKAKTIHRLLGEGYTVRASNGHIRDLPENRLGVDVSAGFRPEYVEVPGRRRILQELRTAAKGVEAVLLAPDPDREGEAIAWHLKAVLEDLVPPDRFYRVTYNEITPTAIRRAFETLGRIDERRVDSQQARRILDRLVGFKVSKIVRRQVRGGSSAGRVQSVALRLVCEREDAIESFVPEEYWILGARIAKQVDPRDPFLVRLARIGGEKAEITTGEQAQKVRSELEGRTLRVADIKRREMRKRPPPPFITSSLQQAGARVCGFSPSRTMRVAQGLYEGIDLGGGAVGLITYMRTDSVTVAASAQDAARAFIGEAFGKEYLPDRPPVYRSRGGAQQAHEAIRPTDPARRPDDLAGRLAPDQLKLYRVIWQRFIASQMAPAVIAQRTAEIEAVAPETTGVTNAAGEPPTAYLFRATASEVVFPGYMRATGEDRRSTRSPEKDGDGNGNGDDEEIDALPPLEPGEALDLREWMADQKFTQPPARYSEASLVRALEENGIGRPSTYAQTLSVLQIRKYVVREKRQLQPTPEGRAVNRFLTDRMDALFNVAFTAKMEEDLDRIEQGEVDWIDMLTRFYASFETWLKEARAARAAPGQVDRLIECVAQVREWAPETKRGKRVYSDEAFVASLREQVGEGKALTERQLAALRKLAWRYREQVPALTTEAAELGLDDLSQEDREALLPPRDETRTKLDLLDKADFSPPRTVGKRTYDDAAFVASLRSQIDSGKRLSDRQVQALNRLVQRYGPGIEGYEQVRGEVGLDQADDAAPAAEIERLLAEFEAVTEWKAPTRKGKREWDDKAFFASLRDQYRERRSLSPRQVAALGKMAARYRRGPGRSEPPTNGGDAPPSDGRSNTP